MAGMTVAQLFTIFINHIHSGQYPDAKKIAQMKNTTIFIDDSKTFLYLVSPNGTKWRLGAENDGAIRLTRV